MARAAEWAEEMGRNWAGRNDAMDRQLAPLMPIARRAFDPRPGERILDLGCGGGATSRMLAEAVGPEGRVTGIDISPDLIAIARGRGAGLMQLDFVEADAERHGFATAAYDALFSRLGCMFFDDAHAAFVNLRTALAPGARAVLLVFRSPAENPWAAVPAAAVAELIGPPEPQPPDAPGPFGWQAPEIFEPILAGAGFTVIEWEPFEVEFEIGTGKDPDPLTRAIEIVTRIGPVARRMRDAPETQMAELRALLRTALAPYIRAGAVRMPARLWLIRAKA